MKEIKNTELMFWGEYCVQARKDLGMDDIAMIRLKKCKVVRDDGYFQYLRPIKNAY